MRCVTSGQYMRNLDFVGFEKQNERAALIHKGWALGN